MYNNYLKFQFLIKNINLIKILTKFYFKVQNLNLSPSNPAITLKTINKNTHY